MIQEFPLSQIILALTSCFLGHDDDSFDESQQGTQNVACQFGNTMSGEYELQVHYFLDHMLEFGMVKVDSNSIPIVPTGLITKKVTGKYAPTDLR